MRESSRAALDAGNFPHYCSSHTSPPEPAMLTNPFNCPPSVYRSMDRAAVVELIGAAQAVASPVAA